MRVVIAIDKFKGSLSASEVTKHLISGLLSADSSLIVDALAVADGGEGTLEAALVAGFTRHPVTVAGPTGMPVDAAIAVQGDKAIIETALACGLQALPDGVVDPLGATSLGAGQLIRAALDLGCREIVVGVGGSACTDGGAGLLVGLGARLRDKDGVDLALGGGELARVVDIDLDGLHAGIGSTQFVLAGDVSNPLLGVRGAAAVYAPQKGASPDEVMLLEAALTNYANVFIDEVGADALRALSASGSGAAGGIGFAVMVALHARRQLGIDFVRELTRLDDRLKGADLVITGEGSLDDQSLEGKTPFGVAQSAARMGVAAIAVCGRTTLSEQQLTGIGFTRTLSLMDLEPDAAKSISGAAALLEQTGKTVGLSMRELTSKM